MTEGSGRRVVLGVGNILNRDEGLGVHAVRALERRIGSAGVEAVDLVDGGVLGLDLLPMVEECSHLLVLDAVSAGSAPGTLVELGRDEIPLFSGIQLSQHQVTLQEVLGLAAIRDRLPGNLHLVGVQPGDVSIGLEMSDDVEAAIPVMVDRAVAVLRGWALLPEAADV